MRPISLVGVSGFVIGGLLSLSCTSPGGLYGHIGVAIAPKKQPRSSATDLATHAKSQFWKAFHEDRYADLPEATRLLTAAYLEAPSDPKITLLLAHAHLWTISERSRDESVAGDPRVTDHLVLAEHYFRQAQSLNPADQRIPGWIGSVHMAAGAVNHDQRMIREGYFLLHDAFRAWPEFNGFTFAYSLSPADADSPQYAEAIEALWTTTDACGQARVNRQSPDARSYLHLQTNTGRRAVCWNSDIAPHNYEGFWLNMGDMLVKADQPDVAKAAYENARNIDSFAAWRYRSTLEDRIKWLISPTSAPSPVAPPLMFNSAYSCVACHAR